MAFEHLQSLDALYTEERPWGSFTVLMDSETCKVKRLEVLPGHRLSLQMHYKREEHWIVTRGEPEITVGEETKTYKKGDYVFIGKETKHRMGNQSDAPVEIIEIQLGDYFGEDDIVRFDDDYKRV